ncbi:MAG TPA: hypothetical protein VGG90_05865 [Candidatus Dormibacteraeota bacterium]
MRSTSAGSLACIGAIIVAFGCSSSSNSFTVGNATVDDTTYTCPAGSNNAAYELHARFDAHNPTSTTVTILSVGATLKLAATKGSWLEKVGDVYDAGKASFTPNSVAPGASASVNVTIASACTSAKAPGATSSYGEYEVMLHVTSSGGSFNTVTANRHRLIA